MPKPHAGKVFGIGFHKTGTSSLGHALEILGYSCRGVTKAALPYLVSGDLEPVFGLVDRYQAFQDNPWPILFAQLDARYPESRFVLTVRESNDWLASVVNHFGTRQTEMRHWIYGAGAPVGNESTYLRRYLEHNTEVGRYFRDRPDDLLVMEICAGDGWERLCRFLGQQTPNLPYPRENVRRAGQLGLNHQGPTAGRSISATL